MAPINHPFSYRLTRLLRPHQLLGKDLRGLVAEGPFLASTNRPSTRGPQRAVEEDSRQTDSEISIVIASLLCQARPARSLPAPVHGQKQLPPRPGTYAVTSRWPTEVCPDQHQGLPCCKYQV